MNINGWHGGPFQNPHSDSESASSDGSMEDLDICATSRITLCSVCEDMYKGRLIKVGRVRETTFYAITKEGYGVGREAWQHVIDACKTLEMTDVVDFTSSELRSLRPLHQREPYETDLAIYYSCRSCKAFNASVYWRAKPGSKSDNEDVSRIWGLPLIQHSANAATSSETPSTCLRNYPELKVIIVYIYDKHPELIDFVPNYHLFGPRYPPSPGQEEKSIPAQTLAKIRRWLSSCQHHAECNEESAKHLTVVSQKPRRLLRITSSQSSGLHLHLCAYQDIERVTPAPRYATLSHCWGGRELSTKLTRQSYDRYVSGIAVSELPATFRDCAKFLHLVDIEFVWIDALCIVQDDQGDWLHEAPSMAPTYSNATLNVAASSSSDPDGGLFLQTKTSFRTDIHALWESDLVPGGWYRLRYEAEDERYKPICPLNTRGWVTQERLLSTRVIEFHHDQIQWQCRESSATDNLVPQIDHHARLSPLKEALQMSTAKVHIGWAVLVEQYSSKRLSFPKDRLIAFAAIAQIFARHNNLQGTDYVAGLWRRDLEAQLLWATKEVRENVDDDNSAKEMMKDSYCAPSWSWACRPNTVSFDVDFNGSDECSATNPVWHSKFKVLEIEVQTVGGTAFGLVTSGYLDIECLLLPVRLQEPLHYRPSDLATTRDVLIGGDRRLLSTAVMDIAVPPSEAFFVPMVEVNRKIYGLLLRCDNEKRHTFRRIGRAAVILPSPGEIRDKVVAWWMHGEQFHVDCTVGAGGYTPRIRIV